MTSTRVSVQARAPGGSRTRIPSRPLSSAGRVPGGSRRAQGVRIVGDEDDRRVAVHEPAVVDQPEARRGRARAEHLCGRREQGARLRVAVARLVYGIAVDPDRDVVQEKAAVDLGDVDAALDALRERIERPDRVAAVDARVQREVVSRTGGDADERESWATAAAATTASEPSPPATPSASAPPASASSSNAARGRSGLTSITSRPRSARLLDQSRAGSLAAA